jgi:SAM-dependent methyltransferase
MRASFPLFNTPIDLSHHLWERLLEEGSEVVDATCGNGKDSLFLAKLLESKQGKLYCIDIQDKALIHTKELLQKEANSFLSAVSFFHQSHETFPEEIKPDSLKLIVFNLGYLPGADKSKTTQVHSTLQSVKTALTLLKDGGVLSITCYPGHEEGKKEEKALLNLLSTLNPSLWCFSAFYWPNRKDSPSLFLVQKKG